MVMVMRTAVWYVCVCVQLACLLACGAMHAMPSVPLCADRFDARTHLCTHTLVGWGACRSHARTRAHTHSTVPRMCTAGKKGHSSSHSKSGIGTRQSGEQATWAHEPMWHGTRVCGLAGWLLASCVGYAPVQACPMHHSPRRMPTCMHAHSLSPALTSIPPYAVMVTVTVTCARVGVCRVAAVARESRVSTSTPPCTLACACRSAFRGGQAGAARGSP